MLNPRTATPPTLFPRNDFSAWGTQLRVGPTSGLIRFIIILVAICALANVYLWQASLIAATRSDAMELRGQLTDLEQENVALMLQLARWNSPSFIEERAQELGLRNVSAPMRIALPAETPLANASHASGSAAFWQRLTSWLPMLGVSPETMKTAQVK